ncbi:hypothetical protein [Variovorax arabinosiphilus]|uniref:hypothetical protein n=1 Tax=Variovorax arabinosiphilus TaxID=3053498 RepID=UPI0025752D32|nr:MULTISPECIES: hypothetical protein [unclassified Variovorax]MDM0118300.1 hypothetical protein [Variovorax sp. J2L1-78]MDM0128725.1 hypothetical protein [Variovorax sp. J2L1-63]MDM0233489.1 hypothetical protein [Variovorax sp. J2R1-6]
MPTTTSTQAFFLRRDAAPWHRVARLGVGVLLGAACAFSTVAQTGSPLAKAMETAAVTVELQQSKVVQATDGKEQLLDAASVKPGDVLEYTVTYTNKTGKPVSGLVADLPIPEGLEYLPRSAKPGATLVKAAVKDGAFAAEPLMRKTRDGKAEPVPYSDYRALRWTLGQLPAGGVASVSARAKVEVVVPPVPKTASATPPATPSASALH